MITIDEMQAMLDEIAETFPREFFAQLNGGIVLMPKAQPDRRPGAQGLYVLGEYYSGGSLGRYIAIYYGSLRGCTGACCPVSEERLAATLKHEFRHHLESLAGERSLIVEDEQFLADYIRQRQL